VRLEAPTPGGALSKRNRYRSSGISFGRSDSQDRMHFGAEVNARLEAWFRLLVILSLVAAF
jgi:hypothetical protein